MTGPTTIETTPRDTLDPCPQIEVIAEAVRKALPEACAAEGVINEYPIARAVSAALNQSTKAREPDEAMIEAGIHTLRHHPPIEGKTRAEVDGQYVRGIYLAMEAARAPTKARETDLTNGERVAGDLAFLSGGFMHDAPAARETDREAWNPDGNPISRLRAIAASAEPLGLATVQTGDLRALVAEHRAFEARASSASQRG